MAMQEKTCCFTGHRDIPPAGKETIIRQLEDIMIRLIHAGICRFVAGGAIGFDTLAAQAVLRLRGRYPDIELILALPCLNQTKRWGESDIAVYETIKAQADEVVYTAQDYSRGCMQRRNRYMVDNSGICVCYCTEDRGGTAYTVHYAKKKGLPVVNIAHLLHSGQHPEAKGLTDRMEETMMDNFKFETFIDSFGNEFQEYVSTIIANLSKNDSDYQALWKQIKEISEQYPNVSQVLDETEAVELSKQECEALVKSMVLQHKLSYLEMQAVYLRGCCDCVGYMKKAGIL